MSATTTVILSCEACAREVTCALPDPLDLGALRALVAGLHAPATCAQWDQALVTFAEDRTTLYVELGIPPGVCTGCAINPATVAAGTHLRLCDQCAVEELLAEGPPPRSPYSEPDGGAE